MAEGAPSPNLNGKGEVHIQLPPTRKEHLADLLMRWIWFLYNEMSCSMLQIDKMKVYYVNIFIFWVCNEIYNLMRRDNFVAYPSLSSTTGQHYPGIVTSLIWWILPLPVLRGHPIHGIACICRHRSESWTCGIWYWWPPLCLYCTNMCSGPTNYSLVILYSHFTSHIWD